MSRETAEAARVEDAVLTRAAQAGEVVALGLLLERHRAGMRAVA
ncbi:sigma-70 family RNA polymerase sigma factor, partial [Streptomyces hyaluromycini]